MTKQFGSHDRVSRVLDATMTPQPPTPLAPSPFRHVGFWALVAAALGLLIVLIGIGLPMMDPKPSVGTQIGEIAGEMRRAAWRGLVQKSYMALGYLLLET